MLLQQRRLLMKLSPSLPRHRLRLCSSPCHLPLKLAAAGEDAASVGPATVLTFAYSDWVSGWRQDSSAFYGRPWTVVYGALSQ